MDTPRDGFRLLGKSPEEIGLRISQVREHKKWSRRTLAKEAGISHQYLAQIEAGTAKNVSDSIYTRLAQALGWHSMAILLANEQLDPPAMKVATWPRWLRSFDDPEAIAERAAEIARRQVLEDLREGRAPLGEGARRVVQSDAVQLRERETAYEREDLKRPILGPVAAARRLRGLPANEDERDQALPPEEWEDELGPNALGIEIEGDSLAGLDIRSGDVAWVNPDVPVKYRSGEDVVIAEAFKGRASEVVIKQIRYWDGRDWLFSITADDEREPLDADDFRIIATVVCVERRRRVFRPGR